MGFCGQMHHRIGAMGGEDAVKCGAVANIGLFKRVEVRARYRGDILKAGCIGQRVKVHHLMPTPYGQPHHGGSDKPGPPGHKDLHSTPSQMKGLSKPAKSGAAASLADKAGAPVRPQSIPMVGSSQRMAPSHSGA